MANRRRVGSPDQEIARIIKMKARKLTQCPEYRDDDPRDIEQDLHVRWLEIRSRHDASRGGIVTYADITLNNHIRNMIAARRTQRRAGRTDALPHPDVHTQTVPPEGRCPDGDVDIDEIGREPDFEALDLRIDLRSVLRKLRPELREITEALAQDGVSGVARSRKVSRPTLYQRLSELRKIFTDWGLDEYLR